MSELFDEVLTTAQTEAYDKKAYKEKKQTERDEVYRLADVTAEKAAASGEVYASYLNVQARFNRYSVTNALLLTAQCPIATKLATFEEWQKNNVQIKAGSKAIMLLEPGKEYERRDNSIGASFNIKKVFDISQTHAITQQTQIHRDQHLLMKALIHNAPCKLAFNDMLPAGIAALYKSEDKTIFVRHGLGFDDMFRVLARELAFAHLDEGKFSRSSCEFKARSIAYLVCAKNQIAPGADIVVPSRFTNQEAKVFKQELGKIRDVANTMHNTMVHVLGKQKQKQASRESEKPHKGNSR